ncbi:protocatechuate 3,4-dioxygenase subunit beta, partial [Streptomyces hainanensis]
MGLTQRDIDREMADQEAAYLRARAAGAPAADHPPR